MLCQQKRTQLPILNIDFAIENKRQTKQTKHSVTGDFCSNLDLNTAHDQNRLSQSAQKSSFDAVLRGRTESSSQLSSLLHYLSTRYQNSRYVGRYTSLSGIIQEYFNADRYKITRDVRDLSTSTESFHRFLRHYPLIRYQFTGHF